MSFTGIRGLESRAPLAVAVSLGVKGPSGNPEDTRRFFVVNARANGKGREAVRALHPDFASFNARYLPPPRPDDGATAEVFRAWEERRDTAAAARVKHAAKCSVINGTLIHAGRESVHIQLSAYKLKGHEHPKGAPSCEGDGVKARRWIDGDYRPIVCPNEMCPHRVRGVKPPDCKPFGLLVFQLRFESLPNLPAKFSTGAWESCANLQGFFDDLDRQSRELGVEQPNYYGLPFKLQITERSNAEKRTKWPVVSIVADFKPGQTLQGFLLRQQSDMRQLRDERRLLSVRSATDEAEDEDAISDDLLALSPGVPGRS